MMRINRPTFAARTCLLLLSLSARGQTLKEVPGAAGVGWSTGSSTDWFGQSVTGRDGKDSGRSGGPGDNQSRGLQITVTGLGTISFWWKVDSESKDDKSKFSIEGNVKSTATTGGSGGGEIEHHGVLGKASLRDPDVCGNDILIGDL